MSHEKMTLVASLAKKLREEREAERQAVEVLIQQHELEVKLLSNKLFLAEAKEWVAQDTYAHICEVLDKVNGETENSK